MKAAVVQMEVAPFRPELNLHRAGQLVDDAARRGASVVLLPELFATGYTYSDRILTSAEPLDGPTVSWIRDRARDRGIHLAGTVLEADGPRIFDTLIWADPSGAIQTRRKADPALFENIYFRRGQLPGVLSIETPGGPRRVGVLISWEMRRRRFVDRLRGQVDLLAIPAAWPSTQGTTMALPWMGERLDRVPRAMPPWIARALGVPVLLANQSGPFETRIPPSAALFRSGFLGRSAIIGSDGSPLVQLGRCEEGIGLADIGV